MFTEAAVVLRTAWRPTRRFRRAHARIVPSSASQPAQAGASPPWILSGVDQPRGVCVTQLVGGRLERDPAVRDSPRPDPVPDQLVQICLVGITRLLPPAPHRARGGR